MLQRLLGRHAHAAGDPLMVVLDQNAVVEPLAMVRAAAATDRVLLQRAETGRGFAGIENGDAIGRRIDEFGRQRRDAAQPLQKVERGAFGFEQRPGAAPHKRNNFPTLHPGPVAPTHLEHARRIQLPEGFGSDVDAGDDQIGLRENGPARALLGADRGGARNVAAAAILGQCLAHEVAIHLRRKFLGDHYASAGFSVICTPGSAAALNTSASVRDAALRSRSTSLRHAMASSVD
jgi:hypothetical protein